MQRQHAGKLPRNGNARKVAGQRQVLERRQRGIKMPRHAIQPDMQRLDPGLAGVDGTPATVHRRPTELLDTALSRPGEEAAVIAAVIEMARPRRSGGRGKRIERRPVDAVVGHHVQIRLLAQAGRPDDQVAAPRFPGEHMAAWRGQAQLIAPSLEYRTRRLTRHVYGCGHTSLPLKTGTLGSPLRYSIGPDGNLDLQ